MSNHHLLDAPVEYYINESRFTDGVEHFHDIKLGNDSATSMGYVVMLF